MVRAVRRFKFLVGELVAAILAIFAEGELSWIMESYRANSQGANFGFLQ
jgi:hypothetical protein